MFTLLSVISILFVFGDWPYIIINELSFIIANRQYNLYLYYCIIGLLIYNKNNR